jgi:hypothetical protein
MTALLGHSLPLSQRHWPTLGPVCGPASSLWPRRLRVCVFENI